MYSVTYLPACYLSLFTIVTRVCAKPDRCLPPQLNGPETSAFPLRSRSESVLTTGLHILFAATQTKVPLPLPGVTIPETLESHTLI